MMLNIYIRELGWKEKDEKYEKDVGEGGGLNHNPLHNRASPPITCLFDKTGQGRELYNNQTASDTNVLRMRRKRRRTKFRVMR